MLRKVVLVDGARTPFLKSFTDYGDMQGYELFRHAMLSTIDRSRIPKKAVEYVIAGIVTHDAKTSNIAREAVPTSGMDPKNTPAHTTTLACISANQAISTGADMIALGKLDTVVAGGVEFLSDPPIKLPRHTRKWFMDLNRAKSAGQRLGLVSKWRPSMMVPEKQAVSEFTTGETMGQCCEKINAMFKVTRQEQDEFAVRSHTLGDRATKAGLLSDIAPIRPDGRDVVSVDNGIRVAPIEKLQKLKPAFVKPHGTVTAANATFLTDGASATLLMSEDKAKELGVNPKATIVDYTFAAVDPLQHLLMGPAHATHKLLQRNKLTLKDIDVFEYHEAFAGQLLCNLKAMDSDWYAENVIRGKIKVGAVPMEKLNTWGGSVSIGHPFGATGSRLVNMAVNRLQKEGGRYALVAACAGGGHGHAMLIEKY